LAILSTATRAAVAAASTLLCLAAAVGAAGAPSIAGTKAEIATLGRDVAALDIRVGQAVEAHNRAIDRLEAAQETLSATRGELSGARRDLESSRASLSERLVALYVSGQPSFIETLLTTGSLTAAEQTGQLLDQVARRDAGVVVTVRERRLRLARLERTQEEAERVRATELDASAERRTELTAVVADRRALLAEARAELTRQVAQERERRARLAALAKARQSALTSMPVAGQTALSGALPAGRYLFPVAGAATFSNDWMFGRPGGRLHQGIDLFAARGTPVVAVADGSAFRVGYNGLGGWRMWLRDTGGNTFYYAHLDAFSPAAVEGASVARGTVLGYVGDSGDARGTSPHLHFEIHPGGAGPVPPYPVITGWPRAA
jgi:murein DD-endopeptidase MepM/ murein hydrolase activator NlpD